MAKRNRVVDKLAIVAGIVLTVCIGFPIVSTYVEKQESLELRKMGASVKAENRTIPVLALLAKEKGWRVVLSELEFERDSSGKLARDSNGRPIPGRREQEVDPRIAVSSTNSLEGYSLDVYGQDHMEFIGVSRTAMLTAYGVGTEWTYEVFNSYCYP